MVRRVAVFFIRQIAEHRGYFVHRCRAPGIVMDGGGITLRPGTSITRFVLVFS